MIRPRPSLVRGLPLRDLWIPGRKANAMGEELSSSDSVTDVGGGATEASPGATTRADDGTSGRSAAEQRRAKAPRIIWLLAAMIVVGVPTAVGVATFFSPSAPAESPSDSAIGELNSAAPPRSSVFEDVTGPRWVRPAWAETVPELTVFELAAGNDVSFANGRLRPSVGISCADGQTDVYVTTGGTAQINPETSGHVVNLTFDQTGALAQQWVAADNQRALFAQNGLAVAGRIATARQLHFGFTHYMSGSVVVDFDLRGADDVLASMAEPCGWGD